MKEWLTTVATGILSLLAISSLCANWDWDCSVVYLALLSGVLFIIVMMCAYQASHNGATVDGWKLPPRWVAVFLVGLAVGANVAGFANIYNQTHTIIYQESSRPHSLAGKPLQGRLDAVYFSAATLTTLGYGDLAPKGRGGEEIVMWQLASGFLLLLVILPIVTGRIGDWDELTTGDVAVELENASAAIEKAKAVLGQ